MEKTPKISFETPSNNQSSPADFSKREMVKELALKILLLGVEISVAVGTFSLFTEKYLISVFPHLLPWHLTVTCVGVNLLALFILGVGISWMKEQLSPLLKKHSWKIKIVYEDLIKACVVGCLSRIAKSIYTHENPILTFKGLEIIPLEAAIITGAVLLAFMNMQHTGTRLYEHEEIPAPKEAPPPAKMQETEVFTISTDLKSLGYIIDNQRETISAQLEGILELKNRNQKLELKNSELENQIWQARKNDGLIKHLETTCNDYYKIIEESSNQLKQVEKLQSIIKQQSARIQKLKEEKEQLILGCRDQQNQIDQLQKKDRQLNREVASFEKMPGTNKNEQNEELIRLQQENKALRQAMEANHEQIRKLQEFALPLYEENQILAAKIKEQMQQQK